MTVQEAMKGAHLLESTLLQCAINARIIVLMSKQCKSLGLQLRSPNFLRIKNFWIEMIVGHLHHISIQVQRKERYCQIYNETIDIATEEVKRWVDQSDIRMIREIMSLLLKFANGNFLIHYLKKLLTF